MQLVLVLPCLWHAPHRKLGSAWHTCSPCVGICCFFFFFKPILDESECVCRKKYFGHLNRGLLWRAGWQAAHSDSSQSHKSLPHSARFKWTIILGDVQPLLKLMAALPLTSPGDRILCTLNHQNSFYQWNLSSFCWNVPYCFFGDDATH